MASKQVNVTFVSDEGCSVNINGTVSYGLLPPRVTGFSGTITLSGGAGCPGGTLTFGSGTRAAAPARPAHAGKLTVAFDTQDADKLKKITWAGDKAATALLNRAEVNRALCNAVRAVPYATIAAAA